MCNKPQKLKRKKESANKWQLFQNHLIYVLSCTSIHGLVHLVRKRRLLIERFLWILLVLGGTYLSIQQALQAWNRYQNNSVVITIDRNYYNATFDFPTIIICLRGLSSSARSYLKVFKEKYNLSAEISDLEEYTNDLLFTNYFTYKLLKKYANGTKQDLVSPNLFLELVNNTAARLTTNKKANQRRGSAQNTRWPKNKESEYVLILTEFGVCHCFHSKLSNHFAVDAFLERKSLSKKYNKITMSLKDANLILNQKKIANDFLLFTVASNEIFDINSHYISIVSTFLLTCSLNLLDIVSTDQIKMLEADQRNCKFEYETVGISHSSVYSYKICRIECRINLCLKYCHCTPYYYRRNDREKICNMTGMYCLSKFPELINLIDPKTDEDMCPCLRNCENQEVTVNVVTNSTWFLDSTLTIRVDTIPKEKYKRTLVFSKTDLLFQVGGSFGLFLGCSILSLIEIPYYFTLRLFWGVFRRRPIKTKV